MNARPLDELREGQAALRGSGRAQPRHRDRRHFPGLCPVRLDVKPSLCMAFSRIRAQASIRDASPNAPDRSVGCSRGPRPAVLNSGSPVGARARVLCKRPCGPRARRHSHCRSRPRHPHILTPIRQGDKA